MENMDSACIKPFYGQKVKITSFSEYDEMLNSGAKVGDVGIIVATFGHEYGDSRIWIYVSGKKSFYSLKTNQVACEGIYSEKYIGKLIRDMKRSDTYKKEKLLLHQVILNLQQAQRVFRAINNSLKESN